MTETGKWLCRAFVVVAALQARSSSANPVLTCSQIHKGEVVLEVTKFFGEKSWGLVGKAKSSKVPYIKAGESVGVAFRKHMIYAADANGVEYDSWGDIGKEKTVTVCGAPTPPKFFRTADCKDINGKPIADCKPNDPWQMWGVVLKGGEGSGSGDDDTGGGGTVSGGDAPVCSDRAYCTGSGFNKLMEFQIEAIAGATLTSDVALCRCEGRCGEVRRWAAGTAEFIGDAVTVNSNTVTVDKGTIRNYKAPKVGETAYLVWKPCGK